MYSHWIPLSLAKRLSIYKKGRSGHLFWKCNEPLELGVKIEDEWYRIPLYDIYWQGPDNNQCRTTVFVHYDELITFGSDIGEINCQKWKEKYWE